MQGMKEKRLRFGGLEVAVANDARRVERTRRSLPYRNLVRPSLELTGRPVGIALVEAALDPAPDGDAAFESVERVSRSGPTDRPDGRRRSCSGGGRRGSRRSRAEQGRRGTPCP